MRTTLDIDDDLLMAVNELARRENRTSGQVVSGMLRRSLTDIDGPVPAAGRLAVGGFVPFYAYPGVVVTNEMVNGLRDEEAI